MKMIKLVLQAPLQSWGVRSRWDSRDTASSPTKSAIIGIFGSALGYPRGDVRLAELSEALHIAVRTDRQGTICSDFHTVQAPEGQKIMNAQGSPRCENIVTRRQYLQDARFTAIVWGSEKTINACEKALRNPMWAVYLGRKSCVPSIPLIPEIIYSDNIIDAITDEAPDGSYIEVEWTNDAIQQKNEHLVEKIDNVVDAHINNYRSRKIRAFVFKKEGDE